MEDYKIFIDTDSEITFILERILKSKHERNVLVIPDRSSFLSSRTNLKILKKIIDKSNKLVMLVTLDDFGAKLARLANFTVLSRVGEITESHWELIQKNKFENLKSKSKKTSLPVSSIELNIDGADPKPLIKYLKVEEVPNKEDFSEEKSDNTALSVAILEDINNKANLNIDIDFEDQSKENKVADSIYKKNRNEKKSLNTSRNKSVSSRIRYKPSPLDSKKSSLSFNIHSTPKMTEDKKKKK